MCFLFFSFMLDSRGDIRRKTLVIRIVLYHEEMGTEGNMISSRGSTG